jgi:hypothetical protein
MTLHSIAIEKTKRWFIRSSILPEPMPAAERSVKYVQAMADQITDGVESAH